MNCVKFGCVTNDLLIYIQSVLFVHCVFVNIYLYSTLNGGIQVDNGTFIWECGINEVQLLNWRPLKIDAYLIQVDMVIACTVHTHAHTHKWHYNSFYRNIYRPDRGFL